jgi:serine protease Do
VKSTTLSFLFFCSVLSACAFAQTEDAAPTASKRVSLQTGNEITGTILKETEEKVWLDLGYDVMEIPRERIRSVTDVETADETENETANFKDTLWASRSQVQNRAVEAWVERLGEGVVEIRSRSGQGSGFIINPQGMVVTNHHVIAGDRELTVTVFRNTPQGLKRVQYKNIRIVALDPARDLALLSIEDELEAPLKWLPMGGSDSIQTGETVFAIGSPLGLDRTVSRGIVSLADRLIGGRLFLQTTAEINPGNSGGPLFNLQGEVVGVNTLKFMQTGIEGFGFSIPSESVKLFVNKRNAFAFDPRNPNTGYHYLNPPRKSEGLSTPTP